MQKTQSKKTTSFLIVSVTGVKIAKIETSFLEVWYSCSNNSLFYYNYSTKFCSNHILLCLNNSDFYYCSFYSHPAWLH